MRYCETSMGLGRYHYCITHRYELVGDVCNDAKETEAASGSGELGFICDLLVDAVEVNILNCTN
jgi:hypothetical protein